MVYSGVGSADSATRILNGVLHANIVADQKVWDHTPVQHMVSAAGGAAILHKTFRVTASSKELASEICSLIDTSV